MTAASPTPTPRDAGAELDAHIDRVVLGMETTCSHGIYCADILPYSGDLSSAWLIVEHLQAQGWSFALWTVPEWSSVIRMPMAAFRLSVHPPSLYGDQGDRTAVAEGETPALAICRAALRAIEDRAEAGDGS